MKEKYFWKFLSKDWRIWAHYIVLVFGIYAWFLLGDNILNFSGWIWWQMLIFWFVGIALIDQLVHYLFRKLGMNI